MILVDKIESKENVKDLRKTCERLYLKLNSERKEKGKEKEKEKRKKISLGTKLRKTLS